MFLEAGIHDYKLKVHRPYGSELRQYALYHHRNFFVGKDIYALVYEAAPDLAASYEHVIVHIFLIVKEILVAELEVLSLQCVHIVLILVIQAYDFEVEVS